MSHSGKYLGQRGPRSHTRQSDMEVEAPDSPNCCSDCEFSDPLTILNWRCNPPETQRPLTKAETCDCSLATITTLATIALTVIVTLLGLTLLLLATGKEGGAGDTIRELIYGQSLNLSCSTELDTQSNDSDTSDWAARYSHGTRSKRNDINLWVDSVIPDSRTGTPTAIQTPTQPEPQTKTAPTIGALALYLADQKLARENKLTTNTKEDTLATERLI